MNRYLHILRAAARQSDSQPAMLKLPAVAPKERLLRGNVSAPGPGARTVEIGDRVCEYWIWDGSHLAGAQIALDTETRAIGSPDDVPDLALASASDGADHYLIHPDRLGEFILAHHDRQVVAHNAAFDFWVVDRHLRRRRQSEALAAWWRIPHEGRLHDTVLLDSLIRLARDDEYPRPRDLGTVAREYADLPIDKHDPYRLRYGEIIDNDWDSVEKGFFTYAIKDAIATQIVYERMAPIAEQLLADYEDQVLPGCVHRFGILTDVIQVQAAIALAAITRNGLHLDREQVSETQASLRQEVTKHAAALEAMPCAAGVLKKDKTGSLRLRAREKIT